MPSICVRSSARIRSCTRKTDVPRSQPCTAPLPHHSAISAVAQEPRQRRPAAHAGLCAPSPTPSCDTAQSRSRDLRPHLRVLTIPRGASVVYRAPPRVPAEQAPSRLSTEPRCPTHPWSARSPTCTWGTGPSHPSTQHGPAPTHHRVRAAPACRQSAGRPACPQSMRPPPVRGACAAPPVRRARAAQSVHRARATPPFPRAAPLVHRARATTPFPQAASLVHRARAAPPIHRARPARVHRSHLPPLNPHPAHLPRSFHRSRARDRVRSVVRVRVEQWRAGGASVPDRSRCRAPDQRRGFT